MGRSGRAKNKRNAVSDKVAQKRVTHYYSLLQGWSDYGSPVLFKTAAAALCFQLSRYLRDCLCYDIACSPEWLQCVGGISVSSTKDILKYPIKTNSQIETKYFKGIPAFHFSPSLLARISKTHYQHSSGSIFRTNAVNIPGCIRVANRNGVPQPRDPNTRLINIGYKIKFHFKNGNEKFHENFQEIAMHLQRLKLDTDTNIVVSLGCGVPVTELNSSFLCLCIDKSKRALSAGVMISKYNNKQSRCVFEYMDFREQLKELLLVVSKTTGLKLKILF